MDIQAAAQQVGFCAVLALVSAAAVRVMVRVGTLDVPGHRSSHVTPTPKGGGVGIVLAFLLGTFLLYRFAHYSAVADIYFLSVVAAAISVAVISFLDDRFAWPAWVKLAVQVLAAVAAVLAGLNLPYIRLPGLGTLVLGPLGPVVTVVWIVGLTNAVNFIDGLNGLASGVVAIACLALAAIAGWVGSGFIYYASITLLSGLAGFLPFNFPSARIFMGDVGSQFCGFMLAVLAIAAGRLDGVDLSIALVPMLVSGVLFDVIYTLVRRYRAGDRLFQAHRTHLYQLANRCGMSAVRVTLVHWGFALWGAVCCAGLVAAAPEWKAVWAAMVVPPQIVWLVLVRRWCRQAGLRPPYASGG